jgi:hypothetical protein
VSSRPQQAPLSDISAASIPHFCQFLPSSFLPHPQWTFAPPDLLTSRRVSELSPFFFTFLRTHLHFFAISKNSTPLFPSVSALNVKKTQLPGRGDGHAADKIESRETNVWLARPTR